MFWQDPGECFFSSDPDSTNCTDTSFALVWSKWKFIKRIYSKETEEDSTVELYDIEADPGERLNLASNPNHTFAKEDLMLKLATWEQNWFTTPFYETISSLYGCES